MLSADEPEESSRLIPLYDATTTGGYNGIVSASDQRVSLVGRIDPGSWFGRNVDMAIRHFGDSMTEYPHGCYLAVREVKSRHLIVYGQNYVVETSEYRVTKRLQRGSSPDTVSLYSSNEETYADGRRIHEPFELPVSEIRRIFRVEGYIVNEAGDCRIYPLPGRE